MPYTRSVRFESVSRRRRVVAAYRVLWSASKTVAVLAFLLLGVAAPAQGAATGIADSEANTFVANPDLWRKLGVKRVRAIVPYDIATRPASDTRRQKFEAWLNALPPGTSTNVGLERITEPIIDGVRPAGYGHAPDETTYRNNFRAFVATYGSRVDRIGPWNEPNFNPRNESRLLLPGGAQYLHEPGGGCDTPRPRASNCGPLMAAYYWRWAKVDCPTCKLIAGELAGDTSSNYIQKYKHHLGTHRPDLWSVHNYSDVIRFQVSRDHQAAELKTFLREIYCTSGNHCTASTSWRSGRVWIGATAANYSLACSEHPKWPDCPGKFTKGAPAPGVALFGPRSQCRAAAFINRFENIDPRIARIYFYTYMDVAGSNPAGSDDSGIVHLNGLTARRAYAIVRDRAKSCRLQGTGATVPDEPLSPDESLSPDAPPDASSPPDQSPDPAPPTPPPSSSYSSSTTLRGDGSYAAMSADHSILVGCDLDRDSHRAYLRRYDIWGGLYRPTVYDPDGASGACAVVPVNDWPLGSYNICVETEGCARPVYRAQF